MGEWKHKANKTTKNDKKNEICYCDCVSCLVAFRLIVVKGRPAVVAANNVQLKQEETVNVGQRHDILVPVVVVKGN